MKWFNNIKVEKKIIVLMLLVSLIPLFLVGTLSFLQFRKSIQNSVQEVQNLFMEKKITEIQIWFNDFVSNSKIAASTGSTYQSLNILKDLGGDFTLPQWQERIDLMDTGFKTVVQEYDFPNINILDQSGTVVYSNYPDRIGINLGSRDYFQQALTGQVTFTDFFYSQVTDEYLMAIAIPILSQGASGEVIGVLTVMPGQSVIQAKVLDRLDEFGSTVDSYIINKDGMLITTPRYGSKEAFIDNIDTHAALTLLPHIQSRNNFRNFSTYKNTLDNTVLGNYQVFDFADFSLGMIFEIDSSEAYNEIYRIGALMFMVSLFAVVLIIFSGIFFSKNFKKPIARLLEISKEISDGNLDVNIAVDTQDEIGDLGRAFSKMAFNVNDILLNINLSSEQVSMGAQQLSSSSQALSQGATEQASSIEEISASVEELASQTERNAENSQKANELSNKVKKSAEVGSIKMRDMLVSMDEINSSSANISKIIKVIDEIAFQTNILSLNAAVEAARAGQYGKGFAVVAEEVRNLAARSANAARETTDMIEGSIRTVQNGTKYANETAQALAEIVEGVEKTVKLVEEIASASTEQKIGINQVSNAISQVSQVVQTNSATSQEAAAASQELSSQAEFLKEMVSKFNLKKTTRKINIDKISPDIIKLLEQLENNKNHTTEIQEKAYKNTNNKIDTNNKSLEKINISLNNNDFGKY